MKIYTIVCIFILVLAGFTVHADPLFQEQDRLCRAYQESAVLIMQHRQNNVPMSDVMNMVSGHRIIESIVLDAYNAPVHPTTELKLREVHEFATLIYSNCIFLYRNLQ